MAGRSGFGPTTLEELERCHPNTRLTVTQVAVILGISRRTAYRRAAAGDIPGLHSYSQRRYRWVNAGELRDALDDSGRLPCG